MKLTRGTLLAVGLAVGLAASLAATPRARSADLAAKLSDAEFWKIVEEFSEPNGYFRSDNLLSNELWFQTIVPDLVSHLKPGGVYMGVGPEQNFTYIAALKPRMVFIVDVRRGNLHTQLMYKALFELAKDRADFVSLLFSRKRPDGLTAESPVQDIFTAFQSVPTSEDLYKENFKKLTDHLTKTHGLPLVAEDLERHRLRLPQLFHLRPGHQLQLEHRRWRRLRARRDLRLADDDRRWDGPAAELSGH